ncbi:DNA cytosine methyltransferase [Mycolicibacterium sp.]|uniref:DNA cytosine methyltransferase n=1 Tax=Mycolicibacterium sp. TaxID=2320850 RepID=UPI0037C84A2A
MVTLRATDIAAVDLFCGAGGLSYGLQQAKIPVVAGIDIDKRCAYPFESNIGSPFLQADVRDISSDDLAPFWSHAKYRILAGCAPCQPFSTHRRGANTSAERAWPLVGEFGRIVRESLPEFVTMENVVGLRHKEPFHKLVDLLTTLGYSVDYANCFAPRYGLAQNRRRLVLVGSRISDISVPQGHLAPEQFRTVRQAIGGLPALGSGESSADDRLHVARSLTDLNLRRIRASVPGGTWQDWPESLRSNCHLKESGSSFRSVYSRMEWDNPSPTITTQFFNFGTGRFGHPEQDRTLTLREAAILQGFPKKYRFVRPKDPVEFHPLGRLIGNAVPPRLAKAVGKAIISSINEAAA